VMLAESLDAWGICRDEFGHRKSAGEGGGER
jgi:hypothetical protein